MSTVIDKSVKIDFRKRRGKSRGRQVDPVALSEIHELLGDSSRNRDMLIESLHLIQDRYFQYSIHRSAPRCRP